MRRTACILLLAAGCTVDGAPDLATSKDEASSLAVAIEWVTSSADIPHVSASSAKAVWVAAALDGVGIDPVAPYADPVFRISDNAGAGAVIDLVGPDAVNRFYRDRAGMSASALTQWSYGRTRVAGNSPRAMDSDNYFTAADAATFSAACGAASYGPTSEPARSRRDRLQLHGALTGCRACNGVDTVQRNIGVRARSAQLRARATTRRGTAVAGSSLHEADPPRRSPPRRRLRCRPGHRV